MKPLSKYMKKHLESVQENQWSQLELPLSVELGPGLISQMFDGIQRPLERFQEVTASDFLVRGVQVPNLDRDTKWAFVPSVAEGDRGESLETSSVPFRRPIWWEHRIMVPFGVSGRVTKIAGSSYTVEEPVYEIEQARW